MCAVIGAYDTMFVRGIIGDGGAHPIRTTTARARLFCLRRVQRKLFHTRNGRARRAQGSHGGVTSA